MDLFGFLAVILTFVVIWLSYRYFTKTESMLREQGITCVPSYLSAIELMQMFYKPMHEVLNENYKKYGKIYGQIVFNAYSLVVNDPEIIRHVLVKDFHNFVDRVHFESNDAVFDNIITIVRGEKWKRIRTVISPTFSTGKIKKMTSVILDCNETLRKNIQKVADEQKPFDVKKLISAFTMDTIASTAFGTKVDSHNDIDNPLVVAAQKVFNRSNLWKMLLFMIFSPLLKIFGYKPKNIFPTRFFEKIATRLIEERRRTNQPRNDFLQLMINASEKSRMGLIDPDDDEVKLVSDDKDSLLAHKEEQNDNSVNSMGKNNEFKGLSEIEIIAQCIIFFIGGFETVASAVTFALYELAINEECQETLIQELDEVLRRDNNELGYENVQNMKYMDGVVSEVLRKYPPALFLQRVATSDCKLADTNIKIRKGTQIAITAYALHYDEEYFPEPEKFDPNRFTPEAKAARNPYVYLPFGAGPRNCIAMRFALFEVKLCLASLLRDFRVRRCSKTQVPLKFGGGGTQMIAQDIFLIVEKRNDGVH